nr:MAG TPA: hypothetical protein [Microviridae sp.]
MSKRRKIKNVKKDKRIFSKTADRSKKVNNNPPLFRGGIRL